ncbi:hypothetical protein R1sor_011356 [Riccia sorocarpa]|uniref:Gag protein n=1 Tax=Riccia sorocarpa TaxID=122646 RepID=A0ABD3I4K0_9MARC
MSENIPLPTAIMQVVAEIKKTQEATPTITTLEMNRPAATVVEPVSLRPVSQPNPMDNLQAAIQLTTPEVTILPPVVTYTGLMNQVEMQQLQSVVTSPEKVCTTGMIPEVQVAAIENPLTVVKGPEQVQVVEQEAVVDTQPQEARPDKGKEVAAEEATPDANPVEAGVYRKAFTEEIADLCTDGPSLVQLRARFEPMGDPMRPWEYVAAHAKAPSLHMNKVIRNDMDQNLLPAREDLFALVKEMVEQRKRDQEELFSQVFTRNPVPRPGQLNPMREQLDELARCQYRFNCQFTRNIETGALLEIMYGLLDKADPTRKYFTEYEEKMNEMRRQLDRDQEFWFRSRRTDMGHAELRRQFFANSGGPSDPRSPRDRGTSQEEHGASGPSSSNAGPTPPESPGKSK